MTAQRIDLTEIKVALTERIEELAEALLGVPNPETRRGREWRWGAKGSTVVMVSGPKRGLFHSHESGEGGGPLDLIAHARSCNFVEALEWAKGWLGVNGSAPPAPPDPEVLAERARKRAEAEAKAAAEEVTRINFARSVWAASVPAAGTVAEAYLTGTRAIPAPPGGWPEAVRFHPRSKALALSATAADGAVVAVQRVYLTDEARKIGPDEIAERKLPAAKQTHGVGVGAVARLPGPADGPLLLAEGPETGLSVWVATGYETRIALGSLAHHAPQPGRLVVICRDDDREGSPADRMLVRLQEEWITAGVDLMVATPWPERRGDKSDFNDLIQDGGPEAVRARIEIALRPPIPDPEPPIEEPPPDEDWTSSIPEHDDAPASLAEEPREGVIPLGYNRGTYFYFSRAQKQVVALTAARHSKAELMSLASVPHYWERTRFKSDKGAILWDDAIDDMMTKCRDVGIFDPDRLRGRGAWIDNDRAVLHVGDKLIVDGHPAPLMLPGSRNVYEADKPLIGEIPPPLGTREANALVKICQSLRWERPINGTLLAGFLVVAPICGGLLWRSSIWITGPSGCGKSYVYDNILGPALGGMALRVQSKTTEAGIRHRLCADARPVIFDEFEREDAQAGARVQGILDLMRQSSSETGGEIIKGTQNQSGARSYKIRSSFAFCSINVGIEHQADESRVTVLTLRKGDPTRAEAEAAAFEELNALVAATITPEFTAGLLARSVRLLPVIRANAETFARAVALHLKSRRAGDQLGALLAGAYSLHSERLITMEQATDYVTRQGWAAEVVQQDSEANEVRLLTRITQHRLRFSVPNRGAAEATVGKLISAAFGKDPTIPVDVAEGELNQIGIRTDPGGIFVSNTHPALAGILEGSPWSVGWARALKGLPGAEASKPLKFGFGHTARSTFIPLAALGEGGDHGSY